MPDFNNLCNTNNTVIEKYFWKNIKYYRSWSRLYNIFSFTNNYLRNVEIKSLKRLCGQNIHSDYKKNSLQYRGLEYDSKSVQIYYLGISFPKKELFQQWHRETIKIFIFSLVIARKLNKNTKYAIKYRTQLQ